MFLLLLLAIAFWTPTQSIFFGLPGYKITDIEYDITSDLDPQSSIYHPGFATLQLSFSVSPSTPFECIGPCSNSLSISFYRNSMFARSFYIAKDVNVEAFRCYRLTWDLPPTLLSPLRKGADAKKYRREFALEFRYKWLKKWRTSRFTKVKGIQITPLTLSNEKNRDLVLQKKGFFMSMKDTISYLTSVNFQWRRVMRDCLRTRKTFRACSRRKARVFQFATLLKRFERWQLKFGALNDVMFKKSSSNVNEKRTSKRAWSTLSSELEMTIFGAESGKNTKTIRKLMKLWNNVITKSKKQNAWPVFPKAYVHEPPSFLDLAMFLKQNMPSLDDPDRELQETLHVDAATASSLGGMFKTILSKCFPFCRRQTTTTSGTTEQSQSGVSTARTVHLRKRMIPEITLFAMFIIQLFAYAMLFFVIAPALYPHALTNPYFTYRGENLVDGEEPKWISDRT